MAIKKTKVVKTLPISGQFIAIWIYDNRIWSETLTWMKEDKASGDLRLYLYEYNIDEWIEQDVDTWAIDNADLNRQFITLEE